MHYNTNENERKVFAVFVVIFLAVVITAAVLLICGVFDEPAWKPVASYPMTNQHIVWTYAGRG